MNIHNLFLIVSVTLLFTLAAFTNIHQQDEVVWVGQFSEMSTDKDKPEGWEALDFRGVIRTITPTDYSLVENEGTTVVKAESDDASSGLIRRIGVDLQEQPVLEFSWKITGMIEGSDVTIEDGDDYPARVYVVFDYDLDNLSTYRRNKLRVIERFYGKVPARAITYYHAKNEEVDEVFPNPYTDLVKMIPVNSGDDDVGEWKSFSRNVYEDYKRIYDEEPPEVAAVALMTDTDDTGEQTTSYFGDIRFLADIQ